MKKYEFTGETRKIGDITVKRWFLKDPPRSTMGELAALAAEAHRRKISYGQLVSSTADFERFEIVEAYRRGGV